MRTPDLDRREPSHPDWVNVDRHPAWPNGTLTGGLGRRQHLKYVVGHDKHVHAVLVI